MGKITLYHGGNLRDGIKDSLSHKSGRWEYGPGLYLTSNYYTASKYARGSRNLYKVEVESGNNIDDINIDYSTALEFISKHVIANKRKAIINTLDRYVKDDKIAAFILNNSIIDNHAIRGNKINEYRKFLVDNGADYSIVTNAFGWGETMLVVFNFKKVSNIRLSKNEYSDLSGTFSESKYKFDSAYNKLLNNI